MSLEEQSPAEEGAVASNGQAERDGDYDQGVNGHEGDGNVEHEKKIAELRDLIGPQHGYAAIFVSSACLSRYLRARHWNVRKAEKMLKESLKWREHFSPEKICWDDVAKESETGKIYRTAFHDKKGRSVLLMAPGKQNTDDHDGQMRHLVYFLENAIFNLGKGQEQLVWLIDFRGWTLRNSPPMRTSHETLNILQNHYPERLGAAILYEPPFFFQTFWKIIRPFIDPVTFKKIKFVYKNNEASMNELKEMFDIEQLDSTFGGNGSWDYHHEEYAELMRKDDTRREQFYKEKLQEVAYSHEKDEEIELSQG